MGWVVESPKCLGTSGLTGSPLVLWLWGSQGKQGSNFGVSAAGWWVLPSHNVKHLVVVAVFQSRCFY